VDLEEATVLVIPGIVTSLTAEAEDQVQEDSEVRGTHQHQAGEDAETTMRGTSMAPSMRGITTNT